MKITRTLSKRRDAEGRSEIFLRITVDHYRQYRLRSGIFAVAAFWLCGAADGSHSAEAEALATLERRAVQLCAATPRAHLSAGYLRQRLGLYGGRDCPCGIAARMDEFLTARDLSLSRRRQYTTLGGMLARYEASLGRQLGAADFDSGRLAHFVAFLRGERRRGHNTICSIVGRLRAYLRYLGADVEGAAWRRNELYGTPYFLDAGELAVLAAAEIADRRLGQLRDVFVFQCLTGCRVSDLNRLRAGSIVGGALEYVPQKTRRERGEVVRVPLHPAARIIARRYASGDSLLPRVSPAAYNKAIRKLLRRCGITRTVSVLDPVDLVERQRPICDVAGSHIARRTFVGNLYRIVHDPALIGSMSGHAAGSKAFARYRNIDDGMKRALLLQTFCRHTPERPLKKI